MSAFHCLMSVRDEADIVGECLADLLEWADAITVYDTGSTDQTWEIVQDFAARDTRVRPLAKESVFFNDSAVRSFIFEHARKWMKDGDWFLRVDADEFYHIPPPAFVKELMSRDETVAYRQYYDFQFTADDLAFWVNQQGQYESLPINNRLRFFVPLLTTEPRLCRYRTSMKWPGNVSFPLNAGIAARERIPIRHYPNRNPIQMKRRCILRNTMLSDPDNAKYWGVNGGKGWHWCENDWTMFVAEMDKIGMNFWGHGNELPHLGNEDHMSPWPLHRKIAINLALKSGAVRLLDWCKPGWHQSDRPRAISPQIQSECAHLMKSVSYQSCMADLT